MNIENVNSLVIDNVSRALDVYFPNHRDLIIRDTALLFAMDTSIARVLVSHLEKSAYAIKSTQAKEYLLSVYSDKTATISPKFRNSIASLLKQRELNPGSAFAALRDCHSIYSNLTDLKPIGYNTVNKQLRYTKTLEERVEVFHQNFLVGLYSDRDIENVPKSLRNAFSAPVMVEKLEDQSKPFLLTMIEAVQLHMTDEYEKHVLISVKQEIDMAMDFNNSLDNNIL